MPDLIPLARPNITPGDIAEVTRTLESGRLSLGPRLLDFENALAKTCGTAGAVGTSSGTTGLELALKATGVRPGDEVITTSFTFVATANAIHHIGALPVFVDICPDTLNIDAGKIEEAITPATRAILVVHVFGRLTDMDRILAIARRHDLAVVEDACEALGTTLHGRAAGSFGDAGIFGFYPNKVITCGEGGAVVSNDDAILENCRLMRNQGRVAGASSFSADEPGHNYRLSDLQAALGCSQLGRLEELMAERSRLFQAYQARLSSIGKLKTPESPPQEMDVSWFVYVVRISDRWSSTEREALSKQLAADGIETGHYFPAIHEMNAYARPGRCRYGQLPNTEHAARRVLALPFFAGLTDAQIDYVCDSLIKHLSKLDQGSSVLF
jgi:perosamine synthetase